MILPRAIPTTRRCGTRKLPDSWEPGAVLVDFVKKPDADPQQRVENKYQAVSPGRGVLQAQHVDNNEHLQ
jgi:hypothetical protein